MQVKPGAPTGTKIKPGSAPRRTPSNVSWFEAFVNDLLEDAGRKRRSHAATELKLAACSRPLSDEQIAKQLLCLSGSAVEERRYGAVLKVVVAVLRGEPEGMRQSDVRHRAEELLGCSVPASSVKNALVQHCDGPEAIFERLGRGRYRLILTPARA
jgi:hypothetical protein